VRCTARTISESHPLALHDALPIYATEKLYDRLLPWINGLPHHGLYVDNDEALQHCCQRCGSTALTKRGFAYTNLGRYTRYRCKRSEEHTSELQSRENLVCRLPLEK